MGKRNVSKLLSELKKKITHCSLLIKERKHIRISSQPRLNLFFQCSSEVRTGSSKDMTVQPGIWKGQVWKTENNNV